MHGRPPLVCVCACVQKAPIGMNYLEESLFYLSTLERPQAHKVLLPTTQETTLIHQSPLYSVPPSRGPSWAEHFPACSTAEVPSAQPHLTVDPIPKNQQVPKRQTKSNVLISYLYVTEVFFFHKDTNTETKPSSSQHGRVM